MPGGAEVLIKITYVTELGTSGENIVFTLPSTVYPPSQEKSLNNKTQTQLETVKMTEPAGLSLEIGVEMPYEITKIESKTHEILLKRTETKATFQLKKQGEPFLQDFVLQIALKENQPRMYIEVNEEGSYAGMLSFYPRFESNTTPENLEYVFVIDRSASMESSFKEVQRSVRSFLLHLPPGCSFNIIGVGTVLDWLFTECKLADNENKTKALSYINSMKPNYGGI